MKSGKFKFNLFKVFLGGFIGLFLFILVIVLGLHIYTNRFLFPKVFENQKISPQTKRLISADLKTLTGNPLFKKTEFKRNADPYLLSFLAPSSTLSKPMSVMNTTVKRLFNRYPQWVFNKLHFKELTADPEFINLDPKWIEGIKEFDHWSPAHSVFQAQVSSQSDEVLILFQSWAAVYLIKKLQKKDLRAGLKIFRKTAELINSSGTLSAQLDAVRMLKAEYKLLHDFQARDWQLLPLVSIEAYRRLSSAWVHLVREPFFSESLSEFAAYATPQYGACAGASENWLNLFGVRQYLEPKASMELSFVENYQRVERFLSNLVVRCHLPDHSDFFKIENSKSNNLIPESMLNNPSSLGQGRDPFIRYTKILVRLNLNQVPIIRRFLGLWLTSLVMHDSLQVYAVKSQRIDQNSF